MKLFFIRHGETVDNVAGKYAGTTDSALTNHGVLQANRLGAHLAATNVKVTRLFSSDLQRAFRTAEAIRTAQDPKPDTVIQLPVLREQDFGFFEGKTFYERKDSRTSGKDAHLEKHQNEPGFQDVESKEMMRKRADNFVNDHLIGDLGILRSEETVVVVAHGIILTHLWRAFLSHFEPGKVSMAAGVTGADRGMGLEYLGGWSNTGYLELDIKPSKQIAENSGTVSPVLPTPKSPLKSSHPEIENVTDSTALPASGTLAFKSHSPSVPNQPRQLNVILDMSLVVKAVNSQEHLKGLKKTRGGIGSLKHDSSQKTMDTFFKKRRLE